MIRNSGIEIYIFKENDGLSRDERLFRAAEHYFGNEDDTIPAKRAEGVEPLGMYLKREFLQVERTPLGKPYFPKAGHLHLSISHSGAYWVCALAPVEVGVDIQAHTMNRSETRQEATARLGKMARRFFHPVEAKFAETESFYRFFGVWAARESYVKYTGQGIDASFSEHCVIPKAQEAWPELTPPLSVHLMQNPTAAQSTHGVSWQAQGVWFWETVFEENYTLCVCAGEEMPCRVIRCF